MKICIVNPGRCGSTLLLGYLHKRLPGYSLVYEIVNPVLPDVKNIIFKYQYLHCFQPLHGADKYIIIDRKDKEAWLYSTYMSKKHNHFHGALKQEFDFNIEEYNNAKENLNMLYDNMWVPERNRLLSEGADMVWYEDIKIDEDVSINLPYLGNTKLEPVWSTTNQLPNEYIY